MEQREVGILALLNLFFGYMSVTWVELRLNYREG